MYLRISSSILALAMSAVTAFAGLLPGQDAYLIRREAAQSASGDIRPASVIRVNRPQLGTYVQGVVLVKTRGAYGMVRNQGSIDGSPLNKDLAALNVSNIKSAVEHVQDQQLSRSIGLDRMYEIRYNEPMDAFDVCAKLMDNPDVEYAVPVRIHQPFYTPNDPRYSQQTWLPQMSVDKAWDINKGASTVIVAIVDSGTDWQHEDLTASIWTNPKEVPSNGKDDDGNGYIDDVRGWDFVGNVTSTEAQSGILKPDNDPRIVSTQTVNDNNGHGTVVAGCTGASSDNSKGIASPGFKCKLIPIKIGSDNAAVRGLLRGYDAIAYAADLGAHIINCSWGGPGIDPGAQDIIDYATGKGSLVIAASGNDGLNNDSYLQSPSSLKGVLSVGACNGGNRVSDFSNYGNNVMVYAPGENILSTYHGNQYRALSGTSFSSPLTSGVAALVKSLHPDWTPDMIRAQLRGTVDMLTGVSTANRPLYWGRVNAERALRVNASLTSGERQPGLMLSSSTIGGSANGTITSYNRTTIRVTLKNVLADAANVMVTPTTVDGQVKLFATNSISFGNIARNAEGSGSFDIQLDHKFPWYSHSIRIGLAITSGTYTNFEVVEVPVDLSTSNSFSMVAVVPGAVWDNIDYTADGTVYASGSYYGQRSMMRVAGANGGLVNIPFTATALDAVNANQVVIGGLNSSKASVSRSTNGGGSWSTTDISAYATSVVGIVMFDASNGIVIGNPVTGKFGIGKTTNGGGAWTQATGSPIANQNETIITGSVCSKGDAIWFGTSSGRVIYSLNKGTSWSQGSLGVTGAKIVSIAFRDSTNGVILYRASAANDAPYLTAYSVNGGLNWKSVAGDLSAWGITPVKVAANPGHHLLIASKGEVYASDNNGTDWTPVLSKPCAGVRAVAASVVSRPTVVFAGDEVGLLQYRFAGANGPKLPVFTVTEVSFGDLEPGNSRNRTATVRNNGTSDLTVSAFDIVPLGKTPASAFTITATPKNTVLAGSTITVPLRCTASDTGAYSAHLKVTSNGTPSVIELSLVANVKMATSVHEDQLEMGLVSVWPNPATTRLQVSVGAPSQAMIVSLTGIVLRTENLSVGTSTIDVSGLPIGSYQLILMHGLAVKSTTFEIAP